MALTGKTAVVTGGSRGIGRATVRRLARDGARVVFSYRQDQAAADALAREVGGAIAVRADQEDPRSIEALFGPVADGLDSTSSLNTVLPGPGIALYCASKAALEQFTKVAAREYGPRGITVNTVSPGATDTGLLRAGNPPEALEQWTTLTALGRLGEPADIADVVAFLAGPDARWLTGQNIQATGGLIV
jgi:3-oxoacyl-[acyl-carrier protein] reductase